MEQLTVTTTSKGGDCILFKNFKYRKVPRADETRITWRCCQRVCAAKVITDREVTSVVSEVGVHPHPPLTDRASEVVTLAATCKRQAVDNYDTRPRKILCQGTKGLNHVLKPDTDKVKKAMYRARRKILPRLPRSRAEAVEQMATCNVVTSKNEKFCFKNDDGSILLFTCQTNLKLLSDCSTWLGDGTFEFAADKFTQLYTIHGHTQGHNVALASFCLPDKSANTYTAAINLLKDVAEQEAGVNLKPTTVLLDFEDAMLLVARQAFPGIEIRGCKFHFTQNVMKRIRKEKSLLASFRKGENDETGKWLRAFLGLPCLPPDLVSDAYVELMSIAPRSTGIIHKLTDSILTTYIDTSRYPPTLWAREPSADDPTSTNAAERFHGRYNDDFNKAHPNIHIVTKELLDLQEEVYVIERTIRAGIKGEVRNDARLIRNQILEAWVKYKNGEKDMFDYLFYVGNVNHQLKEDRRQRREEREA